MPDWNPRANDIFVRAAEIESPADRRLFVDQQCDGDAALRNQVESLLAAGGQVGSFLQRPAVAPPAGDQTAPFRPITEGPGTVIGPYKLLQHIGEGGFGAVYMAEQEHPVRRKVALKIIKPGMDTREVIARFESERQALAMMDHPNIARVFDAGATESGRPYFVMELVRGIPITDFCDRNKLPARERLKLFVAVCNAVQHAHHKGVIHRDIKPSNVMVTLHDGVPVVKVIDFGVAKATAQKLTERTLFTAYGQMVGTPAYMSPEQAEMSGLDIDTRSDIYSLGVLLYELLTGTTPLDSQQLRKAGYAEMQRLIREEEAPRPSTRFSSLGGEATALATNRGTDVKRLSQLLRSDLDWVVMKALEKDRTRRYGSPANFAADIERYLTEQPVEACPPSAWYRFRKAARRNKAALTTAAVVAAALLLGTVVSVWQAVTARRAEAAAVAERDDKEKALHAEAEQRTAADTARQGMQVERDAANVARAELRKTLYSTTVSLLPATLKAGHVGRAAELLDGFQPGPNDPDLRGFEWHYWDRQVRLHLRELSLDGNVFPIRLSGDGRVGVFGRANAADRQANELEVVDTTTGKVTRSIPIPKQRLSHLILDHAGRRAVGSFVDREERGKARVLAWELTDGRVLHEEAFPSLTGISPTFALSADGRVAAVVKGVTGLASAENTKPVVRIVSLDPPGTELASVPYEARHRDELGTVVFSPDARLLAVATVNSRPAFAGPFGNTQSPAHVTKVQLIDVTRKLVLSMAEFEGYRSRIVFTPDGKRLAAVTDSPHRTILWQIEPDGKLMELRSTPLDAPDWTGVSSYAVVMGPDGTTIAAASPQSPTIRLLDVATGTARGHLTAYGPLRTLAFNADGSRLLAVSYRVSSKADGLVLQEWDVPRAPSQQPVGDTQQPPKEITLTSPDGGRRAVYQPADGKVAISDASGKPLCSITVDPATVYYTRSPAGGQRRHWRVNNLTFSPNGRFLLVNPVRSSAKVFDTDTGTVRWKITATENQVWAPWSVQPATVSAGGRVIALPEAEEVRVVDFNDFRELARIPVANLDRAYFSPDGRRVACVARRSLSNDTKTVEQVALWDLTADPPREVRTMPFGPWRLVFAPDGKRFVTISSPGRGEVWDSVTGERTCQFDAGSNSSDVVFHPSGGSFVAWQKSSSSSSLRDLPAVSDARTGRILYRLEGLAGQVSCVVYSPDGRRLAAVNNRDGQDCEVKLWDAETGRDLLSLTATGAKGSDLNFRPTLGFSPDGHRLMLYHEGGEYVWDATPRPEPKK
ncbi:MAG: WD40 repeat domain-containing serine/threonine-protein kinase [Gemmataceae bacterium]